MAEGSTFATRLPWVAALGFAASAAVSCSQEPTLPRILRDDERPTALEISRAREVGVCELNARPKDYLDELVRVHARCYVAFEIRALSDPKCEGMTLGADFDYSRVKRLSSSAILRSFNQLEDERVFRDFKSAKPDLDVVFVGRFMGESPYHRLIVYSVESVTPSDSRQP